MKKYLFQLVFFLLFFQALPVMSQKVTISLNRSKESFLSFWRITDNNGNEVISANGNLSEESVSFSLEANRFYSLHIIVPETEFSIMLNYELGINGESILRINELSSDKELEYKFFTGTTQPVARIIGGTGASISDFPWMVFYISGEYVCGGTIIAPGWILTAAHCTQDASNNPIPEADMSVIAGRDAPLSDYQGATYNVSEVIRNEKYVPSTAENDIALLRLSTPIENGVSKPIKMVSPIDVLDGAISPGVMAWVTGWGLTKVSPQVVPKYLQKVQLPIVSNEQASVVWGTIPTTDLMAGYLNGLKDACSGDSGGPMVVPVTGENKLAGIISWGNASCDTYGGYTRVSDFLGWISEKTGISDYRPAIPGGNTVICNPADTTRYEVDPFPGGTSYDWKLYPENTGTIMADSIGARVSWSRSYSGQAQVMVRTTVNNVVSDWSKLKVSVAPRRQVLFSSNDVKICEKLPVILTVNAQGDNLSYKWTWNKSPIKSANSNSLSFQYVNPGNSGVYQCEVSNTCGTSYSKDINLTVMPHTAITNLTGNIDVVAGNNTALEVSSEGDNLSFQWQKNGTILSDVNDPALRLYDVNAKDIGVYKVTVNGTCGTVTSDSIYVFVSNNEIAGSIDVLVWPTVASNELNIAVNNDEPYSLLMFNSMGSMIKERKSCLHQTSLNVSTLPGGIYVLKIFSTGFVKTVRIIKN